MYYGEIKTCDIANGVGVRVTLFVSGCTNHCYNCFQPQTWDFHYGKPFDAAAEQVIFAAQADEVIDALNLSENEKSAAKIILNTQIYPTDSNGRDRIFEIEDILYALEDKGFAWQNDAEGAKLFGSVILALLELYGINEMDFADVWLGKREIAPPKSASRARK